MAAVVAVGMTGAMGAGRANVPRSHHFRAGAAAKTAAGRARCTSSVVAAGSSTHGAHWHDGDRLWLPRPADLADDGDNEPKEPDDDSDDNIGDLDRVGGVGQPQTQAAINNTDRDADAAVPQVHVRPECAAAELFEFGVMNKTEDGLEEEGGQSDDAHDGVDVCAGIGQLRAERALVNNQNKQGIKIERSEERIKKLTRDPPVNGILTILTR